MVMVLVNSPPDLAQGLEVTIGEWFVAHVAVNGAIVSLESR